MGKIGLSPIAKKTESSSNVPLLPVSQEIIEKYKNHPEAVNQGKLFPVKSNQKMNAYLKEIANLCRIEKRQLPNIYFQ